MSSLWEFIRNHWVFVVMATLCATGAFRLLEKILSSTSRKRPPPDYAFVVKGLETRLKRLEERDKQLEDKDKPVDVSVRKLATQVNAQYKSAGKQANDLSVPANTTYRQLERALHNIRGRLVELETDRPHFLPPSNAVEPAGIGRDVLSVIVFLTPIIAIAAIGIGMAYIVTH